MHWVDTFKPILATSRVILELNPFGILIRGPIHTGRPMVPCALKNSGWSTKHHLLWVFLGFDPMLLHSSLNQSPPARKAEKTSSVSKHTWPSCEWSLSAAQLLVLGTIRKGPKKHHTTQRHFNTNLALSKRQTEQKYCFCLKIKCVLFWTTQFSPWAPCAANDFLITIVFFCRRKKCSFTGKNPGESLLAFGPIM